MRCSNPTDDPDRLAVQVVCAGYSEALRVPGTRKAVRDFLVESHEVLADAYGLQPMIVEDAPAGPLEGPIADLEEMFWGEDG